MRGVLGSQEKRCSIQISQMMQRRQLLRAISSLGLVAPIFYFPSFAQTIIVEVWKDPNCGCCQSWVDHLEANGFKVDVRNVGNTAARKRLGMPEKLGSCHTAKVNGYVLEGHVPAADICTALARHGVRCEATEAVQPHTNVGRLSFVETITILDRQPAALGWGSDTIVFFIATSF